jgi:tetratricopeptide (TPR) repeat protein
MSEALRQDTNQSQSAPVSKNHVRGIEKVSLWLAWIGIPVFLTLVAYSIWLFGWARGSMDAIAFAQSHAHFSIPVGVSSPDLQKAIEAAVDVSMKRDELLLDKLLLIVGLYSAILSVLALATVIFSRQDAKEQFDSFKTKASDLISSAEKNFDEILSSRLKELDDLKGLVCREFPIISRLQEQVEDLILELEDRFPEDENLNRSRSDTWQTEEKQQDSLIDESKILAVSVVALDQASLLKLYLALARFYFYRYRTGSHTESDAARSHVYATRAIKDNPRSADAYRMRGATTLARYDVKLKEQEKAEGVKESEIAEPLQDLLQHARRDCNQCLKLDPFNAGGFFNLALVSLFEYRRKKDKPEEAALHLDQAIHILQNLLAVKEKVSRAAIEKHFPDVYINLACLFAYKSSLTNEAAVKTELYGQIVGICTDGKNFLRDLKSGKAKTNFKESLTRELNPEGGDFTALPQAAKDKLSALLSTSWDRPDGPTSGEPGAVPPLAATGGDLKA